MRCAHRRYHQWPAWVSIAEYYTLESWVTYYEIWHRRNTSLSRYALYMLSITVSCEWRRESDVERERERNKRSGRGRNDEYMYPYKLYKVDS